MAIYYVWSAAAGSGNGSSWANAFTTLTLALATEVAGDTLYVAHDHAESSATALTLTSSGTVAAPTKVVCVDRAGTVPPVSADRRTTGQIATTGNVGITFGNCTHYDGVIFLAGNSTGVANISLQNSGGWTRFDNCSLRLGSTGASKVTFSIATTYVELNNTTVSFSGVGQSITIGGPGIFRWRNTASALIGSAVPTTVFTMVATQGGQVECIGVDLSAAGSGKTIFGATNSTTKFSLTDCKLNASVTKSAVPTQHGGTEVDMVRAGSAGVNYNVFRHRISGTLEEETTIVRTGGASDGTTAIAWKVITTANCNYSLPFECPPIAIWNDTIGSAVTATVECRAAAIMTDAEIWIEAEYLGDASSPQGSFVNDGQANLLVAAANQTTSTETWGGSTTSFKLAVTFTAAQKGWVYSRVKVGKASATVYIDPLVSLT